LVALRWPHPDSAIDPKTSISKDKIDIVDVFMVFSQAFLTSALQHGEAASFDLNLTHLSLLWEA
jgi:hypothetical protein